MNSPIFRTSIALLFLFTGKCWADRNNNSVATASSLRNNGIQFIENKGQIVDMNYRSRPDVLYVGEGGGSKIYLRKGGMSYVMSQFQRVNEKTPDTNEADILLKDSLALLMYRVDMDFVGARSDVAIIESEQAEGYFNYYLSQCPNGITNVKAYNKIVYENIYKNIDVVWYGGNGETGITAGSGLKYDIIIKSGGDPGVIKLQYSGADDLRVTDKGELRISTGLGEIIEYMPKVYQNISGKIIDIAAKYILEGTIVRIQIGEYNKQFSLIIDPWSTYYGGTGNEEGFSISVDPSGDLAISGRSTSTNLPVSTGAYQTSLSGGGAFSDAFVLKMSAGGNFLWATYFGGTAMEQGEGVSTDASGNVVTVGLTYSTNLPVLASGANVIHQPANGGGSNADAFVLMLDPLGAMLWSTYYGGSALDWGRDVSTDGTNIYLYGETSSGSAISTIGCFQPLLNGAAGSAKDMFVVKFAPNGSRSWGTYVGGSTNEACGGIACDMLTGDMYISGSATGIDFPVFAGHQMVYGGGLGQSDAFLFKFDPAGARIWATYYGGVLVENGYNVTVDKLGNVILGGQTTSTTAISSAGAYQPAYGGGVIGIGDGFIAKFNSSGVRRWGTYLGGNKKEWIFDLATDANNNIYAYGEWEDEATSGNFPISTCAYQTSYGGVEDVFIAKYDTGGQQRCVTYWGGSMEEDIEYQEGIAVNGNSIYITGHSYGGLPVTTGAYQTNYGGGIDDAFISELCINLCESKMLGLDFSANQTTICLRGVLKIEC